MKTFLTMVCMLLAVALLSACAPKEGRIVNKWFEPAHSYPLTTYVQSGKVLIPFTRIVHVPDKWFVEIEDGSGRKGTYEVPKSEYDGLSMGQHFNGVGR